MKTLVLSDGRRLEYELTRKNVRNINMRLAADGTVRVSAGRRVSSAYIEQLLIQRADYFLEAVDRFRERDRKSEPSLCRVNWLGGVYPVRVIRSARERAVLDVTELRVFTLRADDGEYLLSLIRSAVAESFARVADELNAEVREKLSERGLDPPPTKITVKDMRSRWGSCSYERGHISLNVRLSAYPRETVLSVLWHEYAHYWHHDHSAEFYGFLISLYPEYYRWNDLLKS